MLEFKRSGNWGWLWKYNDWCNGAPTTIDRVNDSKSICPFFWKSLWNLVVTPLIYTAATVIIGGVFGAVLFEEPKETPLLFMVIAGYALLGAIGALLWGYCTFCHERVVDKLEARTGKKASKPKEPNLLLEWIKAKKNKVCPMIKWVD